MKQKIKIDVVSDIVCPWCYIGKRRLENAMKRLREDFEFEVIYHPFELNPGLPADGVNQKQYLEQKFGGRERYEELTSRVTEVAALEGLEFDYERQKVSPNTRKLHALIQLASTQGLQHSMVEILFNAYFISGVDLSKNENIIKAATEAGLDESNVNELLQDESFLEQIAREEQEMYKLGITGVPFFIVNNKYGISGAQSAETFEKALRDIGSETVLQGEACDAEDKNC
jgi:predicted DsbA family dithiol-disulfide isomerase